MTKNKALNNMKANRANSAGQLDHVHHIFREVKTEDTDLALKRFKNQVYKEVEKYEHHKNMLHDEIEKSLRKIKSLAIICIVIAIVFMLIWIL